MIGLSAPTPAKRPGVILGCDHAHPSVFQVSRDETSGIVIGSVQFWAVHDMVSSTVYLSGRAAEGVDQGAPGTGRLAESF